LRSWIHKFQYHIIIFTYLTGAPKHWLTSVSVILFKDLKFKKYSLKKSNVTNSNVLITQIFNINLLLKVLKECPKDIFPIFFTPILWHIFHILIFLNNLLHSYYIYIYIYIYYNISYNFCVNIDIVVLYTFYRCINCPKMLIQITHIWW